MRAGQIVYLLYSSEAVQIPAFVSIIVMGLLTALVLVAGGVSYFLGFRIFPSLAVRLTIILVNLLLWALVSFLWYRLFAGLSSARLLSAMSTSLENVWPPAPAPPLDNVTEEPES